MARVHGADAGLIATNPPNAAASPSRENAPRRDIIFVLLIVKLPGYTTMSYIGPRYTRKRCGAPLCKNRSSGAWASPGPGRGLAAGPQGAAGTS